MAERGRRVALLALALGLALARPAVAQHQDEVPFVVTPDHVTLAMLELAGVGPQDFVLDLGSGDGRIVILAAKRFGARGLGVEIVPELVARSRRNAASAGVAERAAFAEQDLFKTDLSDATVITMYLLPDVNLQLRPALLALRPGTRIVSHDWDMGDWRPDRSVVVDAPDKPVGLEKFSRLHLWVVPARLAGAWCGTGGARGAKLQMAQRYQVFDAALSLGAGAQMLAGRIEGQRLRSAGGFEATLNGERLRIGQPGDLPAALADAEFERCAG
jgi:SAM-dependent methyltransferase